jgi:4'-phosphopantetheinyl transferase
VVLLDLTARTDLTVLAAPEEARRQRFDDPQAARRWGNGRALLRTALAEKLGAEPAQLIIERGPKGKPRLAGSDLEFNKTDCGEVALVAMCHGRAVGLDLERHRPVKRADRIALRFFSNEERARLEGQPSPATFFDVWTTKEAVLKCDGRGLGGIPMASFSAPVGGGPTGGRWWVAPVAVGAGWSAAVALDGIASAEVRGPGDLSRR